MLKEVETKEMPKGWVCPRCNTVNAPNKDKCGCINKEDKDKDNRQLLTE